MAKEFEVPIREGFHMRIAEQDGFLAGLGLIASLLISALVFLIAYTIVSLL